MNKLHCILTVVCFAALSVPLHASHELKKNTPELPAIHTQAITPAKGSEDRQGIMGALRMVVKNMSGLDVIFVVTHLKVKNGWAWAVVEPQSKDGTQHYETLAGLLNKQNGHWKYLEGPPEWAECEPNPDCAEPDRYFRNMLKKHPSASMDIFPK